MLRLVGILLTVVLAIAAAVLTWPSFFRLERYFPIAQIVAFRGVLLLAFAALLVIALLFAIARPLRRFAASVAVIAVVALVAGGTVVAMRGVGTDRLPEVTDTSIRVLTWNTAGAATSAEEIARVAIETKSDIVTLPETTIDTGEQVAIAMRELGSPMWAHHAEYPDTEWDAGSTTILISPRLGDYSVIEASQDGTSNTSTVPSAVAMPISGTGPIVVAAHAVAPRPSYMQPWRDDLQWLADQCSADNVILAGDFNATVDHMQALGVDGGVLGRCRDAAAETGNGAVGTWPADVPPLAGAPIDHILATPSWTPTGSRVLTDLDGTGSDHRPLVVQFEPAG